MPQPINNPPPSVAQMLDGLGGALAQDVPTKQPGQNLLIATWNIRAFGGLTEKWRTDTGDSPKRNFSDACAIARILSAFDVIAIQETRENLKALRFVMSRLGQTWGFIVTDVGEGEAANDERLAYVFDAQRVKPSGLAGELVVPEEWLGDIKRGALQRQFARTPYTVSFVAGPQAFTLVTLHVDFADKPADRMAELQAIAIWLAERAKKDDEFNRNMITLGDFNIDRRDDPNWKAFTNTGLTPPFELYDVPRSIFGAQKGKFYDQIAWFTEPNGHDLITLTYERSAGIFKWTDYLLKDMTEREKSWRISDHYPLWAEFRL